MHHGQNIGGEAKKRKLSKHVNFTKMGGKFIFFSEIGGNMQYALLAYCLCLTFWLPLSDLLFASVWPFDCLCLIFCLGGMDAPDWNELGDKTVSVEAIIKDFKIKLGQLGYWTLNQSSVRVLTQALVFWTTVNPVMLLKIIGSLQTAPACFQKEGTAFQCNKRKKFRNRDFYRIIRENVIWY